MMHFLNKNKKDILRNQGAVQKQALDVAYNEFPDPDLEGKHKTTKLDPFAKIRSPVTIKALRDIIQESDKATNYSAKLHISPLKKTFSPS